MALVHRLKRLPPRPGLAGRRGMSAILLSCLALTALGPVTALATHLGARTTGPAPVLAALPVWFEPNLGQAPAGIAYTGHGPSGSLFLAPASARFVVTDPTRTATSFSLHLIGANTRARMTAVSALPGRVNYLLGKDAHGWRRDIRTYAAVRVPDIYPGISLSYQGHEGTLEYSFVLAPHADAARIRLAVAANAAGKTIPLTLDAGGNLVARTAAGSLVQRAPLAFQQTPHGQVTVPARFAWTTSGTLRLALGPYNHDLPLLVDPSLTYATYLGGSGEDAGLAVARDASGAVYLAGYTTSGIDAGGNLTNDFPSSSGAVGFLPLAPTSAYVAKVVLNGQGIADLVYATFLGASSDSGAGTQAAAIAVDSLGQAYVTGSTTGDEFPATANALQPTDPFPNAAVAEGFLAVLNAQGTGLTYATYLGGSDETRADTVALGANGLIVVAGQTAAADFPVTNGSTLNGPDDAFVSELQPGATGAAQLAFSTYFGGEGDDEATTVALEPSGMIDLAGNTSSTTGIATADAAQSVLAGSVNAFVARVNPVATGSPAANVAYATYLGGGGVDTATALALTPTGLLVVSGYTDSGAADSTTTPFPTTANAYQTSFGPGNIDAFVSELQPATAGVAGLVYSTLLGVPAAGAQVRGFAVGVDAAGTVYLAGSADGVLPVTSDAVSNLAVGLSGAFLVELLPDPTLPPASQLAYSGYLSSAGLDAANGIALDAANGSVVVVGSATGGVQTTQGAYQGAAKGGNDAFIATLLPQPQSAPRCQVTALTNQNGAFITLNGVTAPGIGPSATLTLSTNGGGFTLAATPAPSVACIRPGLGTATAIITGAVGTSWGTGVAPGDQVSIAVNLLGPGNVPQVVAQDTTSGAAYTFTGPLPQGSVVVISPTVGIAAAVLLGAVIALDSSSGACHLLMNGAGTMTAGAIQVNGPSGAALCVQGGSTITAGAIAVQGGVSSQGGGVLHGAVTMSAPQAADPYASLPAPAPSMVSCPGSACPNGTNFNAGGQYTLSPGTYNQALNFNGNTTVCLMPGVYYLNAGWNVNGGSKLALCAGADPDAGVLLYFHGGNLQLNGGANLAGLRAAATGPYAGLLYWQVGSNTVALNGAASWGFGGWYEPNGQLILNGGSSLIASSVVVKDLIANGGTMVLAY